MLTFYMAGAVAVVAAAMAVSRRSPMHALLYLLVMLLATAVVLLLLGAQFAAALEVILYAGAIMVLFVFVIMTLGLGPRGGRQEYPVRGRDWIGPVALAAVLLAEWVYLTGSPGPRTLAVAEVSPRAVGASMFGPYLLGVELASMLLLAGLVGAIRLARPDSRSTGILALRAVPPVGQGRQGPAADAPDVPDAPHAPDAHVSSNAHGQALGAPYGDGRGTHGQDARATHGRDAHATPEEDAS